MHENDRKLKSANQVIFNFQKHYRAAVKWRKMKEFTRKWKENWPRWFSFLKEI